MYAKKNDISRVITAYGIFNIWNVI